MLYWNKSILTDWETPDKCWWCGSTDLSREHKYKKTDLDLLYGKSIYPKNDRIGLMRYKTDINPINIQSSTSNYLKFEGALCKKCNNSKSAKMDSAYTSVIQYYLNNELKIKESGYIDFISIFQGDWKEEKKNFYRYCVKHVCSRLVECKIKPSENLINFLNCTENLRDIKFVFQIKNYVIGEPENKIEQLYLGPFNFFCQNHLFVGKKLTSIVSWYTVKQFSINYLYKKYLLQDIDTISENSKLIIDIIEFNKLEGEIFDLNIESPFQSYGELIERLEYFPFEGLNKKMDHYNYLLHY